MGRRHEPYYSKNNMNLYKKFIKSYQNFPKPGVLFWDFTPLNENPKMFRRAITDLKKQVIRKKITKIAAIEAKGFVIGSALAYEMKKPLVLIRKPQLIPGMVWSEDFEKEYGFGTYEIKKNAIKKNDRVLIVYDILAGPGATQAAIRLVDRVGAQVVGCVFVIELEYLKGREALSKYDLISLVKISKK